MNVTFCLVPDIRTFLPFDNAIPHEPRDVCIMIVEPTGFRIPWKNKIIFRISLKVTSTRRDFIYQFYVLVYYNSILERLYIRGNNTFCRKTLIRCNNLKRKKMGYNSILNIYINKLIEFLYTIIKHITMYTYDQVYSKVWLKIFVFDVNSFVRKEFCLTILPKIITNCFTWKPSIVSTNIMH